MVKKKKTTVGWGMDECYCCPARYPSLRRIFESSSSTLVQSPVVYLGAAEGVAGAAGILPWAPGVSAGRGSGKEVGSCGCCLWQSARADSKVSVIQNISWIRRCIHLFQM